MYYSTAPHAIRKIEDMLRSDGALDQAVMELVNESQLRGFGLGAGSLEDEGALFTGSWGLRPLEVERPNFCGTYVAGK